jgi:preprotein translocase subunit YajC
MQPEPTTPGTEPAPGAPAGRGPQAGCNETSGMLMPMALVFVVFYFLLLRPQQKRQRQMDDMLKALRKGDKVRTTGGIRGEIADLTDTDVTLVIADKVKINVLRSHIASRIDRPAAEGKGEDAKT